MSSQRLLVCLAIALIAVIATEVASVPYVNYASNGTNKSHNLIVGYRSPGDKVVLRENIVKNSAWMQIQKVEKTFYVSQWQRITLIQALDQKTNGNGAYASLIGGGPGFNNVTLRFKSQRGHGINFVVELYAR